MSAIPLKADVQRWMVRSVANTVIPPGNGFVLRRAIVVCFANPRSLEGHMRNFNPPILRQEK